MNLIRSEVNIHLPQRARRGRTVIKSPLTPSLSPENGGEGRVRGSSQRKKSNKI
jgi:hypothetical protein